MASTLTNPDIGAVRRPGLFAILVAPFRAVFDVLVHIAEASPRMREIQRLQAMSDEDLAARGLTREGIVQHVFRDKFHS